MSFHNGLVTLLLAAVLLHAHTWNRWVIEQVERKSSLSQWVLKEMYKEMI